MQNLSLKVDGDRLTMEVDLSKTCGTTKGGNLIVATSDYWAKVEGRDDLSLNFVLIKKEKK